MQAKTEQHTRNTQHNFNRTFSETALAAAAAAAVAIAARTQPTCTATVPAVSHNSHAQVSLVTLQHTATQCNALQHTLLSLDNSYAQVVAAALEAAVRHVTLQHAATHCNTHCSVPIIPMHRWWQRRRQRQQAWPCA